MRRFCILALGRKGLSRNTMHCASTVTKPRLRFFSDRQDAFVFLSQCAGFWVTGYRTDQPLEAQRFNFWNNLLFSMTQLHFQFIEQNSNNQNEGQYTCSSKLKNFKFVLNVDFSKFYFNNCKNTIQLTVMKSNIKLF